MPFLEYGVSVPEIGGEANIWGAKLNEKTFPMILQLMRGYQNIPVSGNMSVVFMNGDLASNGLAGFLNFTDAGLSSVPTITLPGVENVYFVRNAGSTHAMSFTAGGNTVSVLPGRYAFILSNGTTLLLWDPVTTAGTLNVTDKNTAVAAAAAAALSEAAAALSAGAADASADLANDKRAEAQGYALYAFNQADRAEDEADRAQELADSLDVSSYYTKAQTDTNIALERRRARNWARAFGGR